MIRDGGPVTPENWRCVIASSTHPTGLSREHGWRSKNELRPCFQPLGLAGHACAHAAGQGTGPESPYGIAFAQDRD